MSARSGLFGIEALRRKPDLTVDRRARRPLGFARHHVANAAVRDVVKSRQAAKREPADAA